MNARRGAGCAVRVQGGASSSVVAPRTRRALSKAAGITAIAMLAACGGPGAKAPNPTRPLEEGRALQIIRKAIIAEGLQPTAPRSEPLKDGKPVDVDVGVESRSFGVAFITAPEAAALGASIPERNLPDQRLNVARAGRKGDARIVLLYEENYVFDDLVGEGHEQTAIRAERQLERDVRDFLTFAQSQNYP